MIYSPRLADALLQTPAYSLAQRAGIPIQALADWNDELLREPRVCVPIDVQALVVVGDEPEAAGVRLDGPLTPGTHVEDDASVEVKRAALTGSAPFDEPAPRDRGIHLHWAMPDALLKGRATDAAPTAADLGLAALPDRWVVTRIMVPAQGAVAVTRSWVIDALTGAAGELGAPPETPDATEALPTDALTGTAGGTLTWTAAYDAARGRFTFHDPQNDLAEDPELAQSLPGGPLGGRATYLVVGWWSDPDLDPLDGIRGTAARGRRLEQLGWQLDEPPAPNYSPIPPILFPSTIGTASAGASIFAAGAAQRYAGAPIAAGLLAGSGVRGAAFVKPSTPPRPEASTLVHGAVVGVPALVEGVADRVRGSDIRPSADRVSVALGTSLYDAFGAVAARSLAPSATPAQRELLEELMVAFVENQLTEIDDPAGAAEIDEAVHAGGFETVASPYPGVTDRLVDGKAPMNDAGRRIGTVKPLKKGFDAVKTTATTEMYFASGTKRSSVIGVGGIADTWTVAASSAAKTKGDVESLVMAATAADAKAYQKAAAARSAAQKPSRADAQAPKVRSEVRPDPPFFQSSDPYVLVRGAGRSRRHGGDGDWLEDGRLKVRTPGLLVDSYRDLLAGSDVLAALPSGAIPGETTALAREALLLSDFAASWLAGRAAAKASVGDRGIQAFEHRFQAEAMLRYSETGAYTGDTVSITRKTDARDRRTLAQVSQGLVQHSVLVGSLPSPVGITAWSQPWCPLWLEYRVEVAGAAGFEAWLLGDNDFTGGAGDDLRRVATARVPLTTGVAQALGGSVDEYLTGEAERDSGHVGIDDDLAGTLSDLGRLAATADMLGASLDGVRRRLLGLEARAFQATDAAGAVQSETTVDAAILLLGGTLRLTGLRVVDTYGRVLEIDPEKAVVPARLDAGPGAVVRAPRFTPPARVRLRFVGAEATSVAGARDARIDEAEPATQVGPVCGFLLPDHVDESIEVFGPDATSLGELLVTGAQGSSGGGVVWEPAPGRPVPADAAPSVGLLADEHVMGRFATGIVVADAAARGAERATGESALAALLRSIDTTLWTIDTTSGAGSAQVGSIVGAPLAVVRAVLSVDLLDDTSTLALSAEAAAERRARYAELMAHGVPVRLGELTRPDDGLVAWFADDDYSHVHLVDKAIAGSASPSGPGRGFLREWGVPVDVTVTDPITHDYVSTETELLVHPGVPRIVTLLMAPGAAVHVTSGIVPRGRVQLQRGWFTPALDDLVPSVRVGPVLIDPGDVRLPLVAALGEDQTLTVREGPTAWRNDAILAATQSAALPDRATVLREGWIRVTPAGGADGR